MEGNNKRQKSVKLKIGKQSRKSIKQKVSFLKKIDKHLVRLNKQRNPKSPISGMKQGISLQILQPLKR